VAENSAAGTVVATLTATDVDGDTLSYALTDAGGTPVVDPNFEIVGNEIRVKTGSDLNFEDATSHGLFVTASDAFETSAPQAVTVTVSDVAEAITLGDGGETFTDTGVTETSVTGGAGADSITGSAGGDQLSGAGGGDQLTGGAGDDRLEGGAGDDVVAAQ
jgi:Ca2+-binding RTX toxin-like protein